VRGHDSCAGCVAEALPRYSVYYASQIESPL
jgi:hypothetical protein